MKISREEFIKFVETSIMDNAVLPKEIEGDEIEVSWKDTSDYGLNAYGIRTEPKQRHGIIEIRY